VAYICAHPACSQAPRPFRSRAGLGRWHSVGNFFRDLGLGAAFMAVIIALQVPFGHLFKIGPHSNVANIIPKSVIELVAWLLLSATAGFCEELIFRGYLTRQFSAWTGSAALANILQAINLKIDVHRFNAPAAAANAGKSRSRRPQWPAETKALTPRS